jgi:mannose-6-phosphate isomerase-like protein (cupin superfamily)
MKLFHLPELLTERQRSHRAYLEFLRVPALSAGLYALPAGAADPQSPHREDEIYLVVTGRASFRAGTENHPVGPGTLIFVEAALEHRFHAITEDLTVLVLFAPAESPPSAE